MHVLLDLTARPVIGHRGARAHAPENTLPSFRLGVEQGADAIELDVRLTADGVPVVLHDPTLDRTTDLSGDVARLPWDRVRLADAGARFSADGGTSYPWRGQDARIPTLAEVVEAFPDVPLLIEIKTPAASDAVRRVLEEQGAVGRSVVASARHAALEPFRGRRFNVGASSVESTRLFRQAMLGVRPAPGSLRYQALFLPFRKWGMLIPSRRFVTMARELGCPMHVWTVNDTELARRFWRTGVCGIVTDSPGLMRAMRDGA
ncbi:MAG: glycerophosphodiester phosphodiesterase [Gemmatimonadaceae bacterium]